MPIPARCRSPVASTKPTVKAIGSAAPGNSLPCACPCATAKTATTASAAAIGIRRAKATSTPSTTTETATSNSPAGNGTPTTPSAPPNAMISGNAIGNSQIAGAPSSAPQIPTQTIAKRWSNPVSGCRNPVPNPAALLATVCASAGSAMSASNPEMATARAARLAIAFTDSFPDCCPAAGLFPRFGQHGAARGALTSRHKPRHRRGSSNTIQLRIAGLAQVCDRFAHESIKGERPMTRLTLKRALLGAAAALSLGAPAMAADHRDAPTIDDYSAIDINDVFMFRKPGDPSKLVVALSTQAI